VMEQLISFGSDCPERSAKPVEGPLRVESGHTPSHPLGSLSTRSHSSALASSMEVCLMMIMLMAAILGWQEPTLDREVGTVISPVVEAVRTEQERQAALPPPRNDRERLERMGALDQAGRMMIGEVDVSVLAPEQRAAAFSAISAIIDPIDRANQKSLLAMVPPEGWFLRSQYGEQAAAAAFHIVQHGDETLWRRFLPALEPLVGTGEVQGEAYAKMYDRLAISEDRPQRYGTQFICNEARWTLAPLEDEAQVGARRAGVGITTPLSVYVEHMANAPPCG
jgi:hypothetical protein